MPNSPVIQRSFPEPDIALLVLDDPSKGANVLSSTCWESYRSIWMRLEKRSDIKGLVIRSGKPGSFIAGADLREFAASFEMSKSQIEQFCHRGRTLFQRLSQNTFVTVAAIDGMCVGGGAELAMWCDRRVMTDSPKAQFGFPEVKLGMFPGWGGTARRRASSAYPTPSSWSPAARMSTHGAAARDGPGVRRRARPSDLQAGRRAP